ncbi:anti-sigma factor [Streptomyces lavendulae]
MGTENPHEATAAYVLDALTEPERAAFEAHLETCPDCAREVREFAATAALLGTAAAVEPPPALRGAVLRRIRELPSDPEPEPGTAGAGPEPEPWAAWGAGPEAQPRAGRGAGPGPETGAAQGPGPEAESGAAQWPGPEAQPGAARRPDPEAGPWAGRGAGPEAEPRAGRGAGPGPETGAAQWPGPEAQRPDPEAGPWAARGAGPEAEPGAARGAGPGPETGVARHRAPRRRAWSRWALAACLAVAAGLGGVAAWQYQRADSARQQARAAEAREAALAGVLSAPDARLASGRIPDGGTGTVVLSRERDRAVFVPSGMAAPPAGRVYQLWFAGPGGMRPAGLMDPARPGAPALLAGPVGGATGVGVTVEPEGGSAAPTTAPLVLLALPGAGTGTRTA